MLLEVMELGKEMEAPKVYSSPPHALVLPDEGGWDPWLKLVPLSHDPSVPPAAVLAEYSTQTISDYPVLMASGSTECHTWGGGFGDWRGNILWSAPERCT